MKSEHFIGIGAGKSGSTWLFNNIRKHPEIFSKNEKEINYFSRHYLNYDLNWYLDKFKKKEKNQITGEFSVEYMNYPGSAERIRQAFGTNISILVILRNPIYRIYSDFRHSQRKGDIPSTQSFNEYISHETNLHVALYADQLKEFFNLFPPSNIKVLFYEEVMESKIDTLHNIFYWLGLKNNGFVPEGIDSYENKGVNYKFLLLENLMTKTSRYLNDKGFGGIVEFMKKAGFPSLIRKLNLKNENIGMPDKDSINFLANYYKQPIQELEDLLSTKISWL